jgi:hypothetical protein
MSGIDWSKAPEGATHCWPAEPEFFKKMEGTWYVWFKNARRWELATIPERLKQLVDRPSPAWSGEGLPPVGTVCEYNLKAGPWFKCEIRYVLDNDQDPEADGWQAVIWCPHLEKEQMAKASGFNFRPIRTPEQIAADEREAEIVRLSDFIQRARDAGLHIGEALHDAGLRFPE